MREDQVFILDNMKYQVNYKDMNLYCLFWGTLSFEQRQKERNEGHAPDTDKSELTIRKEELS